LLALLASLPQERQEQAWGWQALEEKFSADNYSVEGIWEQLLRQVT
jgi:hypothetical protein